MKAPRGYKLIGKAWSYNRAWYIASQHLNLDTSTQILQSHAWFGRYYVYAKRNTIKGA